nr:DUF2399 domain-containing protein [Streptomyces yunnanensis]
MNPWRMTAAGYRAAVARTPHGPVPVASPQHLGDPASTQAMTEHGTAVVEELVADVVLEALAGNWSPVP